MNNQSAVELLFSSKLVGQEELLRDLTAMAAKMSAVLNSVSGPDMSKLFVGSKYGPAGQGTPMASTMAPSGATVTQSHEPVQASPPGANRLRLGPGAYGYGDALTYGSGFNSHFDQDIRDSANNSLYRPNRELEASGMQAQGLLAIRKAGVKLDLSQDEIQAFSTIRDRQKGALGEGREALSKLAKDMADHPEALDKNTAEMRRLVESLERTSKNVEKMNDVIKGEGGIMGGISPMKASLMALSLGGTGLAMLGSMGNTLATRQAYGAQLSNSEGRAVMNGDYGALLIDDMLGGFGKVKQNATQDTLFRAGSRIVGKGLVGAGAGAAGGGLFGGIGAIPGAIAGGIGGAAYGLFDEIMGWNENVNSDIEKKRQIAGLDNAETLAGFRSAIGIHNQGFIGARGVGDAGLSRYMTRSGDLRMGAGMALSANDILQLKQQLIGTGGTAMAGLSGGDLAAVARMQASGAVPNAGFVGGAFYRGGGSARSAYDLAGSAFDTIDRASVGAFMGNIAGEAAQGPGSAFGSAQRGGGVISAMEGYSGQSSGAMALDLQKQQSNMLQTGGSGILGWAGTWGSKNEIAKAMGMEPGELDLEDMVFFNQFKGRMSPEALAMHNERKGRSGRAINQKFLNAAARTVNNIGARGLAMGAGLFAGSGLENSMIQGAANSADALGAEQGLAAYKSGKLFDGSPKASSGQMDKTAAEAGATFYGKEIQVETNKVVNGLRDLARVIPLLTASIAATNDAFNSQHPDSWHAPMMLPPPKQVKLNAIDRHR